MNTKEPTDFTKVLQDVSEEIEKQKKLLVSLEMMLAIQQRILNLENRVLYLEDEGRRLARYVDKRVGK